MGLCVDPAEARVFRCFVVGGSNVSCRRRLSGLRLLCTTGQRADFPIRWRFPPRPARVRQLDPSRSSCRILYCLIVSYVKWVDGLDAARLDVFVEVVRVMIATLNHYSWRRLDVAAKPPRSHLPAMIASARRRLPQSEKRGYHIQLSEPTRCRRAQRVRKETRHSGRSG